MGENKKKPAAREKRFSLAFTASEAAGWLGVLVFVCAWFFVLGILVGRGLVPVPETEKDALNTYLQHKRTESIENRAQNTPSSNLRLGFHEALKTDSPTDRHVIPSSTNTEDDTPSMKQPQTRKPVEIPEIPKVEDETGRENVFTIQVAAVRDETEAIALVGKLKKKGYDAYSTSVELSGGNHWYRVRCGAYASRKEAGPFLEKLEDEGFGPMLVRR